MKLLSHTWAIPVSFLLVGLGAMSPRPATAAFTEGIQSLAITNYTGFILDADAGQTNAAGHREGMATTATVLYETDSAIAATNYYRCEFRLLDPQGQAHPILDAGGLSNTSYRVAETIRLPFLDLGTGKFQMSASRDYAALLKPACPLAPGAPYTVELQLYKRTSLIPLTYKPTGDASNTPPRAYFHFTNLVSPDAALNTLAAVDQAGWQRASVARTVPDKDAFTLDVVWTLARYDNFDEARVSATVAVFFDYELREAATQAPVPLKTSRYVFNSAILNYDVTNGVTWPRVLHRSTTLVLEPAAGVQLDSVNKTYQASVSISTTNLAGQPLVPGNSLALPGQRLLHFNGRLFFGGLEANFTHLAADPSFQQLVAGQYVRALLSVDAASGALTGFPGCAFGDGTPLQVRLRANGDAELHSGSVLITNAPAPWAQASHVNYQRTGALLLEPAGPKSDLLVQLPVGCGWQTNWGSRELSSTLAFTGVALDQNLAPATNATLAQTMFLCEESKPVWIEVLAAEWHPADGSFVFQPSGVVHYVRAAELDALQAATPDLVDPAAGRKPSNEQYFWFLDKAVGPITIRADANGAARLTAQLTLATQGYFRTHFPYDVAVTWGQGGGQVSISQDLVQPAASELRGVSDLEMPYGRDCQAGCGGRVMPGWLTFQPTGDKLQFTPDGGLIGQGVVLSNQFQWGYIAPLNAFAHGIGDFRDAVFHASGFFLRGDQQAPRPEDRPASILLTGVRATDPNKIERPGTRDYGDGLADYAGVNFRGGADRAHQAASVLAGTPTGRYSLTAASKYYARAAGVSGFHEAVPGSFPSSAKLAGYSFNFTNFGLAFLDNDNGNLPSRTRGELVLPYPSDCRFAFNELHFNCLGALAALTPAPAQQQTLSYWLARITPVAMEFRQLPGAECSPTNACLVAAVTLRVGNIDQPLHGVFGFKPDGTLTTDNDSFGDAHSRLKLPNNFQFKGPASEKYRFTPVADACLNNYADAANDNGFLSLAGKLDVPFFTDLKVHLHTSANQNATNAPIQVMGGWPDHGWTANGKNFFSDPAFDPGHRGYPFGITLARYRHQDAVDSVSYLPRAQQSWLGILNLDYPLVWDTTTRAFKSAAPIENKLLVLSLAHQVKYLSAENAELVFGAQYEGLPRLNLATLAVNAVNDATGASTAIARAASARVQQWLADGLSSMDDLLAAQPRQFYTPILDAQVDPFIDQLHAALSNVWVRLPPGQDYPQRAREVLQGWLEGQGPDAVARPLTRIVSDLMTATLAADGVLRKVDNSLGAVENAIDAVAGRVQEINPNTGQVTNVVSGLFAPNGDGQRQIVENLVREAVGQLAAQFIGAVAGSAIHDLMPQVEPALREITAALIEVQANVHQVRQQLDSDLGAQLRARLQQVPGEINAIATAVKASLAEYIDELDYSVGNPFVEHPPSEFKAYIRRKIEDRLFASPLTGALQVMLKERLYDLDARIREAIDSGFQQVNQLILDLISKSLAQVDNKINGFLGDLSDYMGAGQINGYAHINGDSLKLLRLDGHFQWKVPDALEFTGYLQIKELDSGPTASCSVPGGATATEVSCGARDVKLEWLSPDLRVSVDTKFSFATKTIEGVPLMLPLGMGGAFEVVGGIKFEAFEITDLKAAVGFGLLENYLSAFVGVKFQSYELAGGIYFGRTCTLDPIAMWDPDVAEVLGTPPFTGAYAYGQGWIPIYGNGCTFNISAGVGAGAFYFLEGPTYGGRMMAGVSGEALCAVSIRGEIDLIGLKQGGDFRFKGKGRLRGKAGWCPFCLKFSKTVSATYRDGDWDVDY
jgi:hypothetical protein